MTSQTNDLSGNDMAFPVVTEGTRTPNDTHQLGLTKRELFAAMAMQGLYASNGLPASSDADRDRGEIARYRRAEEAVKAADALLSALKDAQP